MRDYESDDDFACIYKITMRNQDWVNPTTDGWIAWECESSCTSDSDEETKWWKNRLHEVTTLNCNMMTRSLRCVLIKVRDLPTYDGLSEVDTFLNKFKREVLKKQCFQALDCVLCTMPERWWGMHKGSFDNWHECMRMMCLWFGKPRVRLTDKYNG